MTQRDLHVLLLTLLTLNSISYVTSAKILAVFPLPSKSHVILGSELLQGLAARGHEVTMLSSFPLKNPPPNYNDIVISLDQMRKVYESNLILQDSTFKFIKFKVADTYAALGMMGEAVYQDDNVQTFINTDQKFDLVIYLKSSIDSLFGLSHKFNASTILFSVIGTSQLSSYLMGSPMGLAYNPSFLLEYPEKMTFWQRFHNVLETTAGHLYLYFYNDDRQRKLLKANFPDAPCLEELRNNIDLSFLNSHIAVDPIKPVFQNMINIGGFYLKKTQELPTDIKQYLDNSKNGVIFFSFGSNLNSANLDHKIINHFLRYFKSSAYDILWNFDLDLNNKSSNVKVVNWLPQRAVLAHPKIKFFFTHGGKGSVTEAIYHAVPMIIIPFYVDQHLNAEYCSRSEIAVKIDSKDISKETLTAAVNKLESDIKYRKNIQQRSELFKYQEVDPMEKAIYWIEFVIKNPGATFFKTPASAMAWYQLVLLDVIGLFVLIILLIIIVLVSISKLVVKLLFKHSSNKRSTKEKGN